MFVWGGCEDLWGRARGGGGGGVDGHAGEEEGDDGSLVAFQKGEITVVWVYDERWESGRNCWGFVVASMGMVRVGVGWVVEGWKGRLGGGGGGGMWTRTWTKEVWGSEGGFIRRWRVFRL